MATQSVRTRLRTQVDAALHRLFDEGYLTGSRPAVELAPPKQKGHGDFACAVALALAKPHRKNPREIAQRLQAALGDGDGLLERTEIAGPGFLNLFLRPTVWHSALEDILQDGAAFLRNDLGAGQRVLVEFVSANPTGPLHIAHGRGAVTGDVVARLLEMSGFEVEREYYINDLGHQADVMARSVHLRYRELYGHRFTPPEEFYPGEYVTEIATRLKDSFGDRFVDADEEAWLGIFRQQGIALMLERIKADLAEFGVTFDTWVSERELTERLGLDGLLRKLERNGAIYNEDGKRWFRTSEYGDDKDRVVVREDGRSTYFASDIAYHDNKLERGFNRMINVWGADHGGYIQRVKAGLSAMGHTPEALTVMLVQMVSLSRGGKPVRMGKRLGTAVWLRDVVQEVGKDATRYFFVMRRSDAQLEFDIELATKKTLDNPVYYAQMGYARLSSIERRAREAGVPEPELGPGALDALMLPEELDLIRYLARVPEVVREAAQTLEPHQLVHCIQELIARFHSYYSQYRNTERVISDDPAKTRARLLLCRALKTVLGSLLETLGVEAPEYMYFEDTLEERHA